MTDPSLKAEITKVLLKHIQDVDVSAAIVQDLATLYRQMEHLLKTDNRKAIRISDGKQVS